MNIVHDVPRRVRILAMAAVVALLSLTVVRAAPVRAQAVTPNGPATISEVDRVFGDDEIASVDIALDGADRAVVAYVAAPNFGTANSGPRRLGLMRCLSNVCGPDRAGTTFTQNGLDPFIAKVAVTPDNLPLIALLDFADETVKLIKCRHVACQSPAGAQVILTAAAPGFAGPLTLELGPDGHPTVGWAQSGTPGLRTSIEYRTISCFDAECETQHSEDSPPSGFRAGDIAVGADGSLTLVTSSASELRVVYRPCLDGSCGETVGRVPVDLARFSLDVELDVLGRPVIAFDHDEGVGLVRCFDAACEAHVVTSPLRDAESSVGDLHLAVGSDFVPVMSFLSGLPTAVVKVARCDSPACANGQADARRVLPGASSPFGFELDSTGNPVLGARTLNLVQVATCDSPGCGVVPVCLGLAVTVDLAAGELPTSGDDVIQGTDEDELIAAGDGDDLVCAEGGDDRVFGQGGDDVVLGGDGDDRLRGGDGADDLDGGPGADDLNGGRDNDRVDGGDGDDLAVRGGTGDDYVNGGNGNDLIVNGNGGVDVVDGGNGDDRLVAGGPRQDSVFGGPGDDVVKGNGGADFVSGGDGDDELRGGPQPDEIHGGDGIDDCNGGTTGDGAVESDEAFNCEAVAAVP